MLAVRRARRSRDWWIALVNLVGCVAFGISAVASYVVPSTGDALDLAGANVFTSLGALCFLIGALLLLPVSPASDDAERRVTLDAGPHPSTKEIS
jgi:hypothetical protein